MVREVARVQHKHKSDELKFSFKRKRAKNSLQLYVDCMRDCQYVSKVTKLTKNS